MTDVLTVAAAMVGWWGSACRVGLMHPSTHRRSVIWFHYACGVLCLVAVGAVALGKGGATGLGMAASIALYMLLTMDDWMPHPPAWAKRPEPLPNTHQNCTEGES